MPASKTVKLIVPKGTDEVNFEQTAYRVDNDGTVDVPEGAVQPLLDKGGCTKPAVDPAPDDSGNVRLRSADGSSCSWGGQNYEADDDGTVTVPHSAYGALASHGFKPVDA